jgi:tetratricopeptide (TPR) repeat protein
VDISPGVFKAGKFFEASNHNVVNNPKVNKIVQDGRQHLLTTSTTYDVITAEPPPPRSAGTVNLYTREYYELTKRALKPGGIVSQWIPLHSQTEKNVYQSFHTFLESFPYAMGWYPTQKELILIGSNQPINIDFHDIEQRLQNPVTQKIMSDIGFDTPYSFLGNIWLLKNELKRLSSDHRIISDNHPSLEFFLSDAKAKNFSDDGVNRFLKSRSSFDDVFEKITQSSYLLSNVQKSAFKKYWDSRLKADYAVTHVKLGNALLDKLSISEAISHYKTAIELKPDYVQAYYNLGNALLNKGNTNEAISHYKTAIELKPDYAQAYYSLGNALLNKGNTNEAISHYKTAIELKPDYAQAYFNLGVALMNKGNTNEAISHYKTAIELKPDYYVAYNNLGVLLKRAGRTEEAISHYKMAIKFKPDSAQAYINLSAAYLNLNKKNFELSLKTLKTLESINPKNPLLHYNFSCYYSLLGNIPQSIDSLKKAIVNGYKNYQSIETDPDLENLRKNSQFKELKSLLLDR